MGGEGLLLAALGNKIGIASVADAGSVARAIRLPFPALLGDARRVRALTIAIYRYVMPVTFAAVGAAAAYYLFIADAP